MNADDVHAKLVRSIENAEAQLTRDEMPPIQREAIRNAVLTGLTQPLALASIALELREARLDGAAEMPPCAGSAGHRWLSPEDAERLEEYGPVPPGHQQCEACLLIWPTHVVADA